MAFGLIVTGLGSIIALIGVDAVGVEVGLSRRDYQRATTGKPADQ